MMGRDDVSVIVRMTFEGAAMRETRSIAARSLRACARGLRTKLVKVRASIEDGDECFVFVFTVSGVRDEVAKVQASLEQFALTGGAVVSVREARLARC